MAEAAAPKPRAKAERTPAAASAPPAPPGPAAGSHGFILVVTGPSGAGKGTLVEHLLRERPDCVFSVSATTRPRRSNEQEGREYLFISEAEFRARIEQGFFLETAEVHGNLYGTPVGPVDEQVRAGRVVVLDVDVQGGASVRRARPDAVSVFVYPPSLEALRLRLEARGTDPASVIEERLQNAPGELAQMSHYGYVIMNDELERAENALLAIHDAERARAHRQRTF